MKKLLIIILSATILRCTGLPTETEVKTYPAPAKQAGEVSFMTFNVENLFDTEHDPGKEDYTFLPLSKKSTEEVAAHCRKQENKFYRRECHDLNWSPELLNKKLANLKQVILQVDEGKGPDILVLVEVENDRVLTQLNQNYLKVAEYKTQILIEGNDPRGIDVAILSRFPVDGKPLLHKIPFKAQSEDEKGRADKLRGILETTLILPDKTRLTVFASHFPSQANPRHWRAQYVEHMNQLIKERRQKNPVIAAGDFNISASEESEAQFFTKTFSQNALVSHIIGCLHCPGSHKYRDSWSFLDVILFSKDLAPNGTAKWKVLPDSIDTPRSQRVHLREDGSPFRFDQENGTGVSDHFPVYVRLAPRSAK